MFGVRPHPSERLEQFDEIIVNERVALQAQQRVEMVLDQGFEQRHEFRGWEFPVDPERH